MSSILRSSKFVRYFFGLARNIIISNRQDIDGSLLQRSQHLAGVFSNSNFATSPLTLQAGSTLERTIRRLDEDARKTGRISVKEVEEALNEIRNIKKASASQALMVIRCCGNLVPEETPEQRTKLVEEIWRTLEKLGVAMDISHYNALLKVYLENEHKFSPTEFLAKLEKKGIEPNRVTYQRLIAGYCQLGDIAGATKILEFMKQKQLPVSEGVFNALILGHSKSDDMESAEGILGVMRQAGLEPSSETYTTLLCGYARRGDKAAIERLLTECKVKDLLISDKDLLEVACTAAISGHDELVDEILKNIRKMVGYNQDAANILLRLITRGKDDAAYKVFQTMQLPVRMESGPKMSGHILVKQMVKSNRSVDQILSLCERLEKDGHTNLGLRLAVESSFIHGNVDLTLDLLRVLKERNEPVKIHYFWPSLVSAGKAGHVNTMFDVLKTIENEFNLVVSTETLKDYFLPYTESHSWQNIMTSLSEMGVRRGQAVVAMVSNLVSRNKLKDAVELALQNPELNMRPGLQVQLLSAALTSTGDVRSVVDLLHILISSGSSLVENEEDEDDGGLEIADIFLRRNINYPEARKYTAMVLKEMLKRGLGIRSSTAEYVANYLRDGMTTEISELLAKLSSGDLRPAALRKSGSASLGTIPIARNPVALERIKERIKANNEPEESLISIVRSLFIAYCYLGDLENALKAKQELLVELKQEATPALLAQLLDVYCGKEDLEGTRQCLEDIKALSPNLELDKVKVARAVKLYIKNNQFDEALNLLNIANPREDKGTGFQSRAQCWQALNTAAETTKDPELVKKLLNALVEKKYIELNNVNLGPVIKAYLLREDVNGALQEFQHCVESYRATPLKNEITKQLIEKEDAANLQTLVDLSTQVHGEINCLYDLVLSFVECGRIRQARKILETPGLSARNNRLRSACQRYKEEGQSELLERLLEATKDLHHINRSEIYDSLLHTYCLVEDVDKALGLWTQMQEEDVNITDEFLVKLGELLKSKGREVPFAIPNLAKSLESAESVKTTVQKQITLPSSSVISKAIKMKDVDEALRIKDSLVASGNQLTRSEVTALVELLIESARLKEAASVVTSVAEDRLPLVRTLNFLILQLSHAGHLDLIKQIGERLPDELKRATSFSNRYMHAAVMAGETKEELNKMENEIDAAATPEEIDQLSARFPRGGINAVLQSSPSHHEQVSRIVDKFHSKGVAGPANILCMFYLSEGQMDKARELYQRYNVSNNSHIMFQNVLIKARNTQNPQLLEELLSLVRDAPSITSDVKGLIYSNIISIYSKAGHFETALAKLEEAVETIPLDRFQINSLSKLKQGLEAKNIPFKYTIPPKRSRESSSSSSSSDVERKKSVAANQ